jgi:hypothetical protein
MQRKVVLLAIALYVVKTIFAETYQQIIMGLNVGV